MAVIRLADVIERPTRRAAIKSELLKIKKAHPQRLLKAQVVVDAARDKDSPLHKFFEWDDAKAAERYRLVQARQLIRAVIVIGPGQKELPCYVSLKSDRKEKGGGYRPVEEVISNRQLMAQLEATCKAELDSTLARFEVLSDLCKRVRRAAGIPAPTARRTA